MSAAINSTAAGSATSDTKTTTTAIPTYHLDQHYPLHVSWTKPLSSSSSTAVPNVANIEIYNRVNQIRFEEDAPKMRRLVKAAFEKAESTGKELSQDILLPNGQTLGQFAILSNAYGWHRQKEKHMEEQQYGDYDDDRDD